MNQKEKREYLIRFLLDESPEYRNTKVPENEEEQKRVLRSLMNLRSPLTADKDFLKIQDEYLQEEIRNKGITDIDNLTPVYENIYLWQGDITTIKADAIVNAANNQMLGCFLPCHACIDNAIHTYAGVQLRLACDKMMKKQGVPEKTGTAKITKAFNLPSSYVIHTVGPIIRDRLTKKDCALLASCYRSCLELAEENNVKSIAFCCISTGEFRFPNEKAAEIAVRTVTQFIVHRQSKVKVIFNVFKDEDYEIYKRLL